MKLLQIVCLVLLSSSLVLAVPRASRGESKNNIVLLEVAEADPCDGVCCGDYGHCEDGSCYCHEGWVGEVCGERDPCWDIDCGEHGDCIVRNENIYGNGDGVCFCAPGWIGQNCEIPNVECEGEFSDWSECSTTCEEGFQTRTYNVSAAQSGWGCECPFEDGLVETKDCFERMCPIDCQGYWGEFGACSQTCEEGTKTRNIIITTEAQYGGQECETVDTATCYDAECPIDCVGHWSEYDTCSTTCDTGFQTKTFIVDVPAQYNGKECDSSAGQLSVRDCNDGYDDVCAIHCEGSWSGYDECPVTCGGGEHTRTYNVAVAANHKGDVCPHADGATENKECGTDGCPVDCVGSWGDFNECSQTCGGGEQTQTFNVSVENINGGASCLDTYGATDGQTETQACNTNFCPEHCEGEWGAFTECDVTCANGQIFQTFSVTTAAAYGGLECDHTDGEVNTETCDAGPCPIDCEGSFGEYDECANDDMCGTGDQTKTFSVTVFPEYGGQDCEFADGHESTRDCDLVPCPIDCEGEFSAWTDCSVTCDIGFQTRDFIVSVEAQYGGVACPADETAECNDRACPVDCVGAWGEYGECSHSCGTDGIQTRGYSVSVAAQHGGAECPHPDGHTSDQACNIWDCPDLCHGVCCGDYGHCNEGTCVCYHGYAGAECEIKL